MQIRYEKLQKLLTEKKLDAVLVSDGYNMRYLSGFTGATGYLLITKNSKTFFSLWGAAWTVGKKIAFA